MNWVLGLTIVGLILFLLLTSSGCTHYEYEDVMEFEGDAWLSNNSECCIRFKDATNTTKVLTCAWSHELNRIETKGVEDG